MTPGEPSERPKGISEAKELTPQQATRLTRAIAAMCETFCRPATEATFYGYKIGLSDLPIEKIEAAVCEAIRTKKFFPTVAELRELCGVYPPDPAVSAFQREWEKAIPHKVYPHHADKKAKRP